MNLQDLIDLQHGFAPVMCISDLGKAYVERLCSATLQADERLATIHEMAVKYCELVKADGAGQGEGKYNLVGSKVSNELLDLTLLMDWSLASMIRSLHPKGCSKPLLALIRRRRELNLERVYEGDKSGFENIKFSEPEAEEWLNKICKPDALHERVAAIAQLMARVRELEEQMPEGIDAENVPQLVLELAILETQVLGVLNDELGEKERIAMAEFKRRWELAHPEQTSDGAAKASVDQEGEEGQNDRQRNHATPAGKQLENPPS